MKQFTRTAILLVIIAILVVYYQHTGQNKTVSPSNFVVISVTPVQVLGASTCHMQGVLPDPDCTPGSIDASVTQGNIHQTICVSGYTKTVRPPVSYTNSLKVQQIKEYGFADTNPYDYEEDHLISLELGGSPTDPKNLWPEPGRSPNPKDRIENLCNQKVCDGEISLDVAQKEIASHWQTACK